MKPIKIAITYRDKVYFLDRVEKETDHYQIGFESDRWSIHLPVAERTGTGNHQQVSQKERYALLHAIPLRLLLYA